MLSGALTMLDKERDSMKVVHVPWPRRLAAWRRGFLGESSLLYELGSNDPRLYVSDYARFVRSPMINFGGSNPVLNDKLLFHYAMQSLAAPVPRIYGIVQRGVTWIDPPASFDTSEGVIGLLRRGLELVLKPVDGGAGRGVYVISLEDGRMRMGGAEIDDAFVTRLLKSGTLIQQRVRQGAYAARIYPDTTNTLRILTMWDYARDEPFIARAVHRFGTAKSGPVDNWTQGGLNANVNVGAGALERVVGFPSAGKLEWRTDHPDTGAQITGAVIPNWDAMTSELLRVSAGLPRIHYVGWDVLVGDDDFFLIEGNSYPALGVVQVHEPLLTDPRVRAFYRHHGVIRA